MFRKTPGPQHWIDEDKRIFGKKYTNDRSGGGSSASRPLGEARVQRLRSNVEDMEKGRTLRKNVQYHDLSGKVASKKRTGR